MIQSAEELVYAKFEEKMRKQTIVEMKEEKKESASDEAEAEESSDSDMEFFDCENDEIFTKAPEEMREIPEEMMNQSRSQTFISPQNFPQSEYPWRTTLPYLREPKQKFGIWSIIKESIGKDFGKITVPVYFNEPLSMLQKAGESLEYFNLLEKANVCEDPSLRLAYVTAFGLTQYANIEDRTLKPFNPVLGETYELLTPDFKFMAEQVSHHPPISACCGYNKSFEMYTHTEVKGGFKGRSLRFTSLGSAFIILKNLKEKYAIERPQVSVHNLIIGQMYLDLIGKSKVRCFTSGYTCEYTCYLKGWRGKDAFKFDGVIRDKEGKKTYEIFGKWNESCTAKNIETGEETLIWELTPRLEQWAHLYHLSLFGLQLNHIDEDLERHLPPTDSRLREDQRALENGDMKAAGEEKLKIEKSQRAIRKEWEKEGREFQPKYFTKEKDEDTGEEPYIFNRLYWKDREEGNWDRIEKMW